MRWKTAHFQKAVSVIYLAH